MLTLTPQLGKTVNYEPPAPAPEPEPAPTTISAGGSGGSRRVVSIPDPITATTTITIAMASTSSPQAITEQITTSTPEAATSTNIVQVTKKPPTPTIAANNAREPAPLKEAIMNVPPQTASVYDASQQPLFARVANAVYNGLHGLWLALKKFF